MTEAKPKKLFKPLSLSNDDGSIVLSERGLRVIDDKNSSMILIPIERLPSFVRDVTEALKVYEHEFAKQAELPANEVDSKNKGAQEVKVAPDKNA